MHRGLIVALTVALGLTVPAPTGAQQDVEDLLDEIEGMIKASRGTVDPPALVRRELAVVEATAGMSATGPIAAALISRDAAVAHVTALFHAQLPPERREPMEIAWQALGLLPPGLGMEQAVLGLYGSQVGGFYDPVRDSLFLLDDMPEIVQVPIVRHELVHALQDQRYDLGRWLAGAEKDEDRAAAMQAVLEGHASEVMNRSTLGELGIDAEALSALEGLGDLESLTDGLGDGLIAELFELFGGDRPGDGASSGGSLLDLGIDAEALGAFVPRDTPAALRAQLLFPYVVGTRFVTSYRAAHPEDPACDALYRRPPQTTAEILDPRRWESGTTAPALRPPGTIMPGFELVYDSALGRLLVWVLLENQADPFAGDPDAARFGRANRDKSVATAAGWAGDRVAVYRRLGAVPGAHVPDSWIVAWTSRWSSPEEAAAISKLVEERVPDVLLATTGGRLDAVVRAPPGQHRGVLEAMSSWN